MILINAFGVCIFGLLYVMLCSADSLFETHKNAKTFTRGSTYMFQIHIQGFSKNGTTQYKKAIFYPTVDQFTRVIVRDSFDWAVHSFDENVTVWIELSSQKFSGYVATQDNPPLKFLYMKEALFVTPYFEFLMLTNCPSGAATGNATELPYECGEVVVAGITREGCAQCAERKDYCDPLFEYCMKPVANYLNQNTTVIPNITFYVGWKGIDANRATMQSSRSLPSTFQQYSITPVADALGRISEDIGSSLSSSRWTGLKYSKYVCLIAFSSTGSLFNTNTKGPMNLDQK